MMDIEIEVLTDFTGRELELAKLLCRFWADQPKEDTRNRFGTPHPPCESVMANLIKNFEVLCLAYAVSGQERHLVGHAEAGRFKDLSGWAELSVATDIHYRRQGVARRLLESTVVSCKIQGIKGIKAYVLPYNRNVINLVQKLKDTVSISCKYQPEGYLEYIFILD